MKTYKQLNVPFEFKPPVEFFTGTSDREIKVPKNLYNQELIDWLDTFGLEIKYSRYFYSPKDFQFPLHIDVMDYPNNYVRLNFIFGGVGSYMTWYELLDKNDNHNFTFHTSENNETVRSYNRDKVKLIDKGYVKSGALVNTGIIHTMYTPEDRHCFAFFMKEKGKDKRLEWDRALEIFDGYFI